MKRLLSILLATASLCCCLSGCHSIEEKINIAATTRPVWEFTTQIIEGTDLSVKLLISESTSCLHDYSLSVKQAKIAENADVIILSGAGLESAIDAMFASKNTIDCSVNIPLLGCTEEDGHGHSEHGHDHETDPHIWLSPSNAKIMATNICDGLSQQYPQYKNAFTNNLNSLLADLEILMDYGNQQLRNLSTRDMITFHDGFAYFARDFGCNILKAIEEESGSEASAAELKELITLVQQHDLPAIFTEVNGSTSAARVIATETGIAVYALDMAMSDQSYFAAMYHNIDTVKEAME